MKNIARWVVIGALFLIPFLPLYVANDMFFPFITSKGFVFRILVELAAGAYVLLALADRRYRPRWSWTLVLYGAFVAWMFIADLFAPNAHKAFWSNYERMDGWVMLIHAFLFFIVSGAVLSADKLWKRWWLTVLAASALVSIHGLWQMFGLADIHQGGARADANFGNAIYLAVYLMFTILIAVWQALQSKGLLRWSLVALAAIQVVILIATATRGAMLGLFGGAVLIALAWAATGAGKGKKIAAGALIALFLLAGSFYLARDSAFVRNEPSLARLATVFNSNELVVRGTLWKMAIEGANERPVTGWGQEGYNFVFNKFYEPSLYAQEQWFDRAHNEYLDWLVAGGYPAPLLFIGALLAAILALYRSKEEKATRLLLAGALAAYALQAVTAFDNLFSYVLAAALLAMAHDMSARPIKVLQEASEPGETAVSAIAAPTVLVVTLAIVWMVNVPSIEASKDLIRAAASKDPAAGLTYMKSALSHGSFATQEIREQLLTFAGNTAQNQGVAANVRQEAAVLAFSEVEKEIAAVPNDARTHLMYAQGLRLAGNLQGALQEMDEALALSPRKQSILLQRGTVKWQMGDLTGASADFEAALALDTRNIQVVQYIAAGRVLQGDVAGAKALITDAFGAPYIDSDVLRVAYFEMKRYGDLVETMKAAVAAREGDVQQRFLLVQAYALAGRNAEARAELQAIVAEHPDQASTAAAVIKQLGL